MLQLDDEDYALLAGGEVDRFEEAFLLESRVSEWAERSKAYPRSRLKEKTPTARFLAAARARKSYDKKRKPRTKVEGTWQERNPEKYDEAHRRAGIAYYYRNKEKMKAKAAAWRAAHPGYMARKKREWLAKKGKKTP